MTGPDIDVDANLRAYRDALRNLPDITEARAERIARAFRAVAASAGAAIASELQSDVDVLNARFPIRVPSLVVHAALIGG